MIRPYTEQEFTDEVVRRSTLTDGQYSINLEQLRELCFDVRLTEEQYGRAMKLIRQADAAEIDPNGGVQHFEGGWRYERVHY